MCRNRSSTVRMIWVTGIIPTTSIEQFGAQVAQWFGLGESEIADVFPHYHRFGRAGFELF